MYQATWHKMEADGYSHPVVPRHVFAAIVSTLETSTNKCVASSNTGLLKAGRRKSSQEIILIKNRIKIPCLMKTLKRYVFWHMNPVLTFATSFLNLILRRSRTGTVWFHTSTSNKRAARPKLYTKSLTRDLNRMYSRLTLVRISINL